MYSSEGFSLPEDKLAVLTEEEIFGRREKRRERRSERAGQQDPGMEPGTEPASGAEGVAP